MNLVNPARPDYRSYLLRLWWDAAQNAWRASLQSTATEQIYHFPSMEALVAFLTACPPIGGDHAAIETPNR